MSCLNRHWQRSRLYQTGSGRASSRSGWLPGLGRAADKEREFSFDCPALDGVNRLREFQPPIKASDSPFLKAAMAKGWPKIRQRRILQRTCAMCSMFIRMDGSSFRRLLEQGTLPSGSPLEDAAGFLNAARHALPFRINSEQFIRCFGKLLRSLNTPPPQILNRGIPDLVYA